MRCDAVSLPLALIRRLSAPPLQKHRWRPQLLSDSSARSKDGAAAPGGQPFSVLHCLLQEGRRSATTAAAPPPLLDVPLLPGPAAGAAAAAPSLRQQLQELVGAGEAAPGHPGASQPAGFVSLADLQPQAGGTAQLHGSHLTRLATVPLPPPPPAPAVPAFLLAAPSGAAAGAASVAAPAGTAPPQLFTLEAPMLPALAATRGADLVAGAPSSAFAHLFEPALEAAAAAPPTLDWAAALGCEPPTLADLVAKDMVAQDDGGLVLPAVVLQPAADEAESAGGCGGVTVAWVF